MRPNSNNNRNDEFRRGFVYGIGVTVICALLYSILFRSSAAADIVDVVAVDSSIPRLSVDVVLECVDDSHRILLHQRNVEPVGVSLLTGFVELGELVEQTAVRVTYEQTGVSIATRDCAQFHVYSDQRRDSRTPHTVGVALVCRAHDCTAARSRPGTIQSFDKHSIPWQYVVFDHGVILRDVLERRFPIWRWLKAQPFIDE